MDAFIKIFVCLCRASHMERKTNSSQFAFVGNAVGAKDAVRPRKGTVCLWVERDVNPIGPVK